MAGRPAVRSTANTGRDLLDRVPDAELIATWQLFRRATGEADALLLDAFAGSDFANDHLDESLASLARAPRLMLPMRELGAGAGLTSGAVTKLVDDLVGRGLVLRRQSVRDRRVVFAVLTDLGVDAEQVSTPAYAVRLRAEFDSVGLERVVELRALCVRLEDAPVPVVPWPDPPRVAVPAQSRYPLSVVPDRLT